MRRRGFTLIEMILVLVVITVALFPLVQSFSAGIRGGKAASDADTAISLARQKMELMRSVPFALIQPTSEAAGSIAGFPGFSREAVVENTAVNLKEVTVNVYWREGADTGVFGVSSYFANF